jgi:putative lipoprotein
MRIDVVAEGTERPPPGAQVVVQVLDTSFADAPAQVVAETTAHVEQGEGDVLQTVELSFTAGGAGADYRVRAHVDVDGDGAVSKGDFVTTAAHPAAGEGAVRVAVRKVT